MSRLLRRLSGFAVAVLFVTAQSGGAEIAGWGTVVDPGGDCAVRQEGGSLVVRVPAGVHDMWYGREDKTKAFSAPRVVREIEGDFVVQVKVTGDFKPALNRYYHGAGLLVFDSERQYVRWERNAVINTKGTVFRFTAPIYDRNDRRIGSGKPSTTVDPFQGRSTWLRLERRGDNLTGSYSHDGATWTTAEVLATELPRRVRVGVHAVNDSAVEFVARFDDLRVGK